MPSETVPMILRVGIVVVLPMTVALENGVVGGTGLAVDDGAHCVRWSGTDRLSSKLHIAEIRSCQVRSKQNHISKLWTLGGHLLDSISMWICKYC
jgi:hypothetical protein